MYAIGITHEARGMPNWHLEGQKGKESYLGNDAKNRARYKIGLQKRTHIYGSYDDVTFKYRLVH
jgi:hypothetical protein